MKKTINRKLLIILSILLISLIIFEVKAWAEEAKFALDKESKEIFLNGFGTINYTGGSGEITWKSSDDSIVTVNNGRIEGHKVGTAVITATRGSESATCEVHVIYRSITIGGNYSKDLITGVNLVLNEHDSENLYANVTDTNYETVKDAKVEWTSSDTGIVTVDKDTGAIKGIKVGKAKITASAEGVSDTCEVNVYGAPKFTDFSSAKYELLFDIDVDLKISGLAPREENEYYYVITSSNKKPEVSMTRYGNIDIENTKEIKHLNVNKDNNYIFANTLNKYVELNQDMYLWVFETAKLENTYSVKEDENIIYSTKLMIEGQKLDKPELPKLNLIIKEMTMNGNHENVEDSTYINFLFPSGVENRKFKLKIGKVTDDSILKKIQNNDYSGIVELLSYAKNNDAIYTADLTTTSICMYSKGATLFNGRSLLQNKAYYFIYVEFDDEQGKYCPIEGVTLAQAWLSQEKQWWTMCAYTSSDFQWNNLSSTDTTVANSRIPQTGTKIITVVFTISVIMGVSIFCYKKYNWYKGIK